MNGKIKFYDKNRGYGFIIPDDPKDQQEHGDVFFHLSGLVDSKGSLVPDDPVTFNIKDGRRGPNGCDIELQDCVKNY